MRSIVLYGIMVGLPVLGTSAILEFGRGLTAFPSVQGDWDITWTGVAGGEPCGGRSLDPIRVAITQSGPVVALTFGDSGTTPQPGRLRRDSDDVVVLDVPADPSTGSRPGAVQRLQARFGLSARPERMQGRISGVGCDHAAQREFSAVRRKPAGPGSTGP